MIIALRATTSTVQPISQIAIRPTHRPCPTIRHSHRPIGGEGSDRPEGPAARSCSSPSHHCWPRTGSRSSPAAELRSSDRHIIVTNSARRLQPADGFAPYPTDLNAVSDRVRQVGRKCPNDGDKACRGRQAATRTASPEEMCPHHPKLSATSDRPPTITQILQVFVDRFTATPRGSHCKTSTLTSPCPQSRSFTRRSRSDKA